MHRSLRRRDLIGLADCENLFDVMVAMDELKSSPLVDIHWAEYHMAGKAVVRAKDLLRLAADVAQPRQMLVDCDRKLFAGPRDRSGQRSHRRGSLASAWKVTQTEQCILAELLNQRRSRTCWSTFGDASFERGPGQLIGKQEVLDDLLNAPTGRARDGA